IFQMNTMEKYLEAVASLLPLPKDLEAWPVINEPHDCKAVRMGRHFVVNDATREPLCAANFAAPSAGSYYCSALIAGGIIIGAERIRKAVQKMVVPSGTDKPLPVITVSLGIAVYPEHAKTFEELIHSSDKALYDSKRAGRNRVSVYMAPAETAGL